MKRFLALVLASLIILSAGACSSAGNTKPENKSAVSENFAKEKSKILKTLKKIDYKGVAIVTKDGKTVINFAKGKDENGDKLTVDSPMYIGSVSKQFCAAAVMILRDKGKLSVNDKLSKYFPEYKNAKKITLKNLLTMRSGISSMFYGNVALISPKNSEEENVKVITKTYLSLDLSYKPDSKYEYVNANYFLLARVVEMISGKSYSDFVRENIFKPLGMNGSGFVDEVRNHPKWAKGLTYDTFGANEDCKGLTKGAGDIVSNNHDMSAWMTALINGKVVKESTFKEMTKNYSPEYTEYGYALEGQTNGGIGHSGLIGSYNSKDYMNKKLGYNIFIATRNNVPVFENIPNMIIRCLKEK